MEIQIERGRNYAVIHVSGDIDLYTSPQLRQEILKLANKKNMAVLVDFRHVTYMDSSGVATLVEALQLTKKNGGRLRLFHLAQPIKDLFELSRLDRVFDVYETEQQAKEGIS